MFSEHSDLDISIVFEEYEQAKRDLSGGNLRLVVSIAKQYSNRSMTLSDLVAEGNLGLMRASEEFDPDAPDINAKYYTKKLKQTFKKFDPILCKPELHSPIPFQALPVPS